MSQQGSRYVSSRACRENRGLWRRQRGKERRKRSRGALPGHQGSSRLEQYSCRRQHAVALCVSLGVLLRAAIATSRPTSKRFVEFALTLFPRRDLARLRPPPRGPPPGRGMWIYGRIRGLRGSSAQRVKALFKLFPPSLMLTYDEIPLKCDTCVNIRQGIQASSAAQPRSSAAEVENEMRVAVGAAHWAGLAMRRCNSGTRLKHQFALELEPSTA